MKLRRIFAAIAACAIAAMSVISASAADVTAVTFVDKIGKATLGDSSKGENTRIMYNIVDLLPEGVKVADIYGYQIDVTLDVDETQGYGGSFILSSKGKNWKGENWTNDDVSGVVKDGDGEIVRIEEEPFFTDTDISGAEGEYAQIVLDAYWGSGTVTVNSIKFLTKDEAAEVAAKYAPKDESKEESKVESTTSTTESTTSSTASATDKNEPTGATAGLALAGLAIAGAAVVAAKKSK